MSLIKPKSHCPKCGKSIKWFDNIPILSYIILRGKCRHCKEHISFRYILVEILNAVLWVLCVYLFYNVSILLMCLYAVVCSILLAIAMIDYEHMYISTRLAILLAIVGVVLCFFADDIMWKERLIGLLVGGGVMLVFYFLGYLMFKREALGIGDIKLMIVSGLIVGYKSIIFALIVGSIVGAIVLSILRGIESRKGIGYNDGIERREYPFAPFLCFGVILAIFVGDFCVDWYLSLI